MRQNRDGDEGTAGEKERREGDGRRNEKGKIVEKNKGGRREKIKRKMGKYRGRWENTRRYGKGRDGDRKNRSARKDEMEKREEE